MTIKRQFISLLLAIIFIPIFCITFVPFYLYMRSPERILMRGWRELVKNNELPLNQNEREQLLSQIKNIPPEMEIALMMNNNTILLSTIPELPAQTSIAPIKIWEVISSTRDMYFYQVMDPFNSSPGGQEIIILSRGMRNSKKYSRISSRRFEIYWPFIFLITFSITFIIAIIYIAYTIFTSISILDKKIQLIAEGDLNISLIGPTEKKRNSNEIIRLTKNLEKMRLALLDNEQRRTRFIMGVSHDLRTPVAVIKGYTEAISDEVMRNPDDIKKSLEIINKRTSQLEEMIDSLINFVKLSNNEWQQNLEETNLLSELYEFIKSVEVMGSLYKRKVTYDFDIPGEIKIPMDRQLFHRAFENITGNAFRYTKDGDVISFAAKTGAAENGEKQIIISVSDTGTGIAKDDITRIFDLFYRGTSSRREEGMGVGLAVVKQIIDSHGWEIDVASEIGKGTTFTIKINYN